MPLTPPTLSQITDGKPLEATPVRKAFEYVCAAITSLTGRILSSEIEWDQAVPPSMVPGFGVANGLPRKSGLYSQALHCQALGLEFLRRAPNTALSSVTDPGHPAPAYGGVVIPSLTGNAVHLFTHEARDNGWAQTTYAMNTGDTPVHCVASATGVIYVACTGSMKIRQIDTRTGIVSDFVSLSSVHSDYGTTADIHKIYINRLGTYLYVLCRRNAAVDLGIFKRCIRISVVDKVMVEKSSPTSRNLLDIGMLYVGASSNSIAHVAVLQATGGGATAVVWLEPENTWAAGNFATTADDAGANPAVFSGATSMVELGERLAAVGTELVSGDLWLALYGYDPTAGGRFTSNETHDDAFAAPSLLSGAAASDGTHLAVLTTNGSVYVRSFTRGNDTDVASSRMSALWHPKYNSAALVLDTGGIAYTGTEFVAAGRTAGGVGFIHVFNI